MRRVDRGSHPVPGAFNGPDSSAAKERAKAWAYVRKAMDTVAQGGARPKAYKFMTYKDEAGRLALEALFQGKCAYCETHYASQAPVDIEHYRPKGGVEDDPDHWGYWWLAADWMNLLPSCIDCNRRRYQVLPTPGTASLADLRNSGKPIWQTGKESAFPVMPGTRALGLGEDPDQEILTERPYLLDPCRDDPDAHLEYLVDSPVPFGLVLPRRLQPGAPDALPLIAVGADIDPGAVPAHVSVRGAVSIQVYGLNRLGLVQARTRVLRQLEALRLMIADADALATKLAQSRSAAAKEALPVIEGFIDRLIAEIRQMGEPDQPYSAMVLQWTDRWVDHLIEDRT
ncbi:endonuclease [Fertoebacter nigrum]|uniref:Endonuclease n=1 Tax=Fertoeibacter niger TaxID=2656921 RepID=A0A8X8KMP0_9RHOB|nr:endonuclease [Fertoeibacter niger]NUB46594.1 endonuclease [Fertoeibacter niger]